MTCLMNQKLKRKLQFEKLINQKISMKRVNNNFYNKLTQITEKNRELEI